MKTKAKKIIPAIIIVIIAGAAAGYYYWWDKPHLNVATAEGIKIDAVSLYKAFAVDSVAAQKKYLQQVVEVTGSVSNISANHENKMIVLIKTGSEGAYINCTMEEVLNNLKEEKIVTIKGICSGLGEGDADLGIMGDLYLVRCYLLK